MTPDEIAADRAVIDAATGGEWSAYGYEVRADFPDGDGCRVAGYVEELDAAFIAAARTGWPRALDALEVMADAVLDEMARAEKAEAEVARLQEDNDRIGAMVEWQAEVIVDARDVCQRAESIEPSGSPEWVESGIAMRTTALREVRTTGTATPTPPRFRSDDLCPVHLDDAATCRGCAADRKARREETT